MAKKKETTKKKQKDLPGMPPKGELTLAAERYLLAREQVEEKKGTLDTAKDALLIEMKAKKVFSVKVEDKLIELRVGAESLAVVKV